MPLYEYECQACGAHFEVMQKVSDRPVRTCRSCKSRRVRRLISAPAVQFKGSGWYVTDYAGEKGRKKGGPAEKETGGKKEAEPSSSTSSGDSQSASKSEAGPSKSSKKEANE